MSTVTKTGANYATAEIQTYPRAEKCPKCKKVIPEHLFTHYALCTQKLTQKEIIAILGGTGKPDVVPDHREVEK